MTVERHPNSSECISSSSNSIIAIPHHGFNTSSQNFEIITHKRLPSISPSISSNSESEHDGTNVAWSESLDDIRAWTSDEGSGRSERTTGTISSVPQELLIHILRQQSEISDLQSALLVSKSWCLAAFPILWQKPGIATITRFASFARVVSNPRSLLPYASTVKRISLSGFAGDLTDEIFMNIGFCHRLERLTASGAHNLTPKSLKHVFARLPELIAIDISDTEAVDDKVVLEIAKHCHRVQGLNLSNCRRLSDQGILAIASGVKTLRRVKLALCHRLTDISLVALIRACPLLVELDLAQVPRLSNDTVIAVFLNLSELREFRINGNENITRGAMLDLELVWKLCQDNNEEIFQFTGVYPWYLTDVHIPKAMSLSSSRPPNIEPSLLRPVALHFEQLRLVDFSNCSHLDDETVVNLVTNAPKLRHISLSRCSNLTDVAVASLARLGKHLHHVHLGHVTGITDDSVIKLAQSCTRLRYLDFTGCIRLTDLSVIELANNLTKLERIGLVKVRELTDNGVRALAKQATSLLRIHLSYCEKITVNAVSYLLKHLVYLNHLSLTGIPTYQKPEYQQFCRAAPSAFNDHQRASFCVFSGQGVSDLRDYLSNQPAPNGSNSEVSSPARDSETSMSSIVLPPASPPLENLDVPPTASFNSGMVVSSQDDDLHRSRELLTTTATLSSEHPDANLLNHSQVADPAEADRLRSRFQDTHTPQSGFRSVSGLSHLSLSDGTPTQLDSLSANRSSESPSARELWRSFRNSVPLPTRIRRPR